MAGISGSRSSSNDNTIRNQETRRSETRQSQTRQTTRQESHGVTERRQATAADYRLVDSRQLNEAMQAARSSGSPFAEVILNGALVLFPTTPSQTTTTQRPANSGDAPAPEEYSPEEGETRSTTQSLLFDSDSSTTQGTTRGSVGSARSGLVGSRGGNSSVDYNSLWESMTLGQNQSDQIEDTRRDLRRMDTQLRYKMRMIALANLLGPEFVLQMLVYQSEDDDKMGNRLFLKQLNRVRETKSKILKAIALKPPPPANASGNATAAADAQNKQAKYTQWVSVSQQLMQEVQQSERTIMDVMKDRMEAKSRLWEFYTDFKRSVNELNKYVIKNSG